MDSRTSRLSKKAEAFYVSASAPDRAEIDRLLRNLCVDPWVNHRNKFVLMYPPAVLTLYSDTRFRIIYHLPDADTLKVLVIAPAGDDDLRL